jgi:hypothetical protein
MGHQPRTTDRRTVALDYGQFTLIGGELEDGWDSSPLLEQAVDVPVAGDGQLLLVLSPHQNSFELDLTVEVWDVEPPTDADDWQQVVRGWLEVERDRLRFESPTMDIEEFDVPTGRYAVEVSGRGFVTYGWPGSTTPGDVWRVRLWPSEVEHPPYAVRRYEPAEDDGAPVGTEPGSDRTLDPAWVATLDPEVLALLPGGAVTLHSLRAAMATAYGPGLPGQEPVAGSDDLGIWAAYDPVDVVP